MVEELAFALMRQRVGVDPALGGTVIQTTVPDVIGWFAFLGLATVLLLRRSPDPSRRDPVHNPDPAG